MILQNNIISLLSDSSHIDNATMCMFADILPHHSTRILDFETFRKNTDNNTNQVLDVIHLEQPQQGHFHLFKMYRFIMLVRTQH